MRVTDPAPGAQPPGQEATVFCQGRGLRKEYRGRPALRGVDLDLARGDIIGLAGPNGAGKTTLARLVAGFLRPTEGVIRLDGQPAAAFRAAHGVGYLPEEAPRLWRCSTRQLLGARPRPPAADAPDTEELLDRLGLARLADVPLPRLSKGQWRLALCAYALVGPSPLVVLDEPDAGLDPAALDRLRGGVAAAAAAGALVLILSHQLGELEAMADRILFLAGGEVVGEIRPRELGPGAARALYRELVR